MMVTRGQVMEGERVLVLGATGGVGTGCVQLAKRAGAEVIATGSSAEKLEALQRIGADHVVDSASVDWVEAVHAIAGKPRMLGTTGVDVVVNYIGGESWARSLRCLRHDGTPAHLWRHGWLRSAHRYPLHLDLRAAHPGLQRVDAR